MTSLGYSRCGLASIESEVRQWVTLRVICGKCGKNRSGDGPTIAKARKSLRTEVKAWARIRLGDKELIYCGECADPIIETYFGKQPR